MTMLQHIPHTWSRLLSFTRLLTLLIGLTAISGCSRPKVGYFSNNEYLTRTLNTALLKYCLPSTDAIDRQKNIHACIWRFKVASCKLASLKSSRISQKKISSDTFLTDLVSRPYRTLLSEACHVTRLSLQVFTAGGSIIRAISQGNGMFVAAVVYH